MASKNVNILLKLTDRFTPQLTSSQRKIKQVERDIKNASNRINRFGRSANQSFLAAAKGATRLAAGVFGLSGVLSAVGIRQFAADCVDGFNAAREAETKLEAILGHVPSIMAQGAGAATAAKDRLVALTDQMEEYGVVAGDVTVAGLQQLATFQVSEATLAQLAPGIADLVAQQKGLNATQSDAVSLGNLVGKAMSGMTGALTLAGIIMTDAQAAIMKTGTEEQRAATMAEILEQNVGGVNRALAQTDAGKLVTAQNLIGRAQDAIGEKLVSIKGKLADLLIRYMPQVETFALGMTDKIGSAVDRLSTWIDSHQQEISSAVDKALSIGSKGLDLLGSSLQFVARNANWLIPVLVGVGSACTAFNVLTKVSKGLQTVSSMFGLAKKAGGALSLTLKVLSGVSGFGLIGVAIGGAVTAGILIYKNWDKIKAAAEALNDKIQSVFGKIHDKITDAFVSAKEKVGPVIDWIQEKIDAIRHGFEVAGQVLSGLGFGSGNADNAASYSSLGKATGTPYWQGGPVRVNEGGRGEIIDLPNGTRIIPHDVAPQAVAGPSITVNLTVQGNVIGNRAYMEETGQYVAHKILDALGTV